MYILKFHKKCLNEEITDDCFTNKLLVCESRTQVGDSQVNNSLLREIKIA